MPRETVFMSEMTWPDFAARMAADPVVLLPVGATEQHAHHMPLGVDQLIPTAICRLVAERIGGLVAPPIPYGYKSQPKSGGGQHFPGTLSLDAGTLIAVVRDVIRELARHGVRRIAVLSGHYENGWFVIEAIDLALREAARDGITGLRVIRLDYWDFISKASEAMLFDGESPNWPLEHAAIMETSVMMHLHPWLVDAAAIVDHPPAEFPPYDLYPVDRGPIPPDGALSSPKPASADKGRRVVEQIVPDIAAALTRGFGPASA
ncbi:creatininase [Zavarzinia sp.]|uniref:creatininase n=1 Tax=Zavarzinia sp. TaxID=2027920 RepID=UPI00356B52C0